MRPSNRKLLRNSRTNLGMIADRLLMIVESISRNRFEKIEVSENSQFKGKVVVFAVYIEKQNDNDWEKIVSVTLKSNFKIIVVNTGPITIQHINPDVYVINRKNAGRDIASYRTGLRTIELDKLDLLILMNDSIIWDHNYLFEILNSDFDENQTIRGLTISNQKIPHLQSYFLVFAKDVVFASNYYISMNTFRFKRTIVRKGEIEASIYWSSAGLKIVSVLDNEILKKRTLNSQGFSEKDKEELIELCKNGVELNPTIHFWPEFFRRTGSLKKSLIHSNPAKFELYPTSIMSAKQLLDVIELPFNFD
jgi:Rhamnan synthesis protein F